MNAESLSWKGDPQLLEKRLEENFEIYRSRFGLRRKQNDSGDGWVYGFEPTEAQLEYCRRLVDSDREEPFERVDRVG
jgi:hypothetical protein